MFPFLISDFVTMEKPQAEQKKGLSMRCPKLQIKNVIGRWSFKLSDGSTWNVKKLKRFNHGHLPLYSDVHAVADFEPDEDELSRLCSAKRPPSPRRYNLRDRTQIRPRERLDP